MPPLAAKDAVNELMAMPWRGLQEQMQDDLEAAIAPLREWEMDTGTKEVSVGGADLVKYRMHLEMAHASVTIAIQPPPGYTHLSAEHLTLAIPREHSWSMEFEGRIGGKFQVWATLLQGTPAESRVDYVDAPVSIPQIARIRNFRLEIDVRLDPADASRPSLRDVSITPRFDIDLDGLITANAAIGGFEAVGRTDGVYQLRRKLTNLSLGGLPHDVAEAKLTADLLVTLIPHIEIEIVGEFSARLDEVGTRNADFHLVIPTGVELPEQLREQIPLVTVNVPRAWGEAFRSDMEDVPAGMDWYQPAREIEEGINAHLPHGQVYDLVYRKVRVSPAGDPAIIGISPRRPPVTVSSAPRAAAIFETVTQYEGYEDTAIWTGHLLAAEAFRYAVAPTEEARAAALARATFVLGGIRKLFEVTTRPQRRAIGPDRRDDRLSGLFARASLVASNPIKTDPPFDDPPANHAERYYGPVTIEGEQWYGFGKADRPPSRDSYIGLVLGFSCAHTLIADATFRSHVLELADRMITYVLNHGFNVPTPPGRIITSFIHQFHHQLALLQLGKLIGHRQATELYDRLAPAAAYTWIPVWGTTLEPLQKYYKFNLSHNAVGVSLFLETEPDLRAGYRKAFDLLRRATRHHRNAYFNLMRILSELPADRAAALNEPAGYNPAFTLAQETRACLSEWLKRRTIVAETNGLPRHKTPDPLYLRSLFPRDVERYEPAFPDLEAGAMPSVEEADSFWASTFPLPVDKRPGKSKDFMWQRHPFASGIALGSRAPATLSPSIGRQLEISDGEPNREAPGVDYLLPVWMAAYLGVIDPPTA